jgi:hypothetical protein
VGQRSGLHDILVHVCGQDTAGNKHVYFQPPESVKIEYPCIIYKRDKLNADYANNQKYAHRTRYQITAIDRNPDVVWQLELFNLPLCEHVRQFATDGLNHDIFDLYY